MYHENEKFFNFKIYKDFNHSIKQIDCKFFIRK